MALLKSEDDEGEKATKEDILAMIANFDSVKKNINNLR